jgi:hypothetical protein
MQNGNMLDGMLVAMFMMDKMADIATVVMADYLRECQSEKEIETLFNTTAALLPSPEMIHATAEEPVIYEKHCRELLDRAKAGGDLDKITKAELFISFKDILEVTQCDQCEKADTCDKRKDGEKIIGNALIIFDSLFTEIIGKEARDQMFEEATEDAISQYDFTREQIEEAEAELVSMNQEVQAAIREMIADSHVERSKPEGNDWQALSPEDKAELLANIRS